MQYQKTTIIAEICDLSWKQKEMLSSLLTTYCSCVRSAYGKVNASKNEITRKKLEEFLSNRYPILDSRYIRDAILEARAIYSSYKEQLPIYIKNCERKIDDIREKKEKYKSGEWTPKSPLERVLAGLDERLTKYTKRLEKFKCQKKTGDYNIIFGGKDSFRKRQNSLITNLEWKQIRNNRVFSHGDKSKQGNLHLRIYYEDNDFYLRIGFPKFNGRCNYKNRVKLKVSNQKHQLLKSTVSNAMQGKKKYSVNIVRKPALAKHADREGKYYAHISLDEPIGAFFIKNIPPKEKVAGIDINVDRLALAIVDFNGNFLESKIFYCHECEYTSIGKRDNVIYETAQKTKNYLIDKKIEYLVMEHLDFSDHPSTNKRFNRMRHNFVHSRFSKALSRICFRNSINIKLVSPAYTSEIGDIKYSKQFGISRHESAAYVLARRGMGFTERIPKYIVDKFEKLKAFLERKAKTVCGEAKDKLKSDIEVLKSWKEWSPNDSSHPWKLWILVSKYKENLSI